MSRVDVIVPCYRYGRFLRHCVESVLNQSLGDVRVLILDDASPDDTPEVASRLLREDSRASYVRHPVNRGHIATYNEGLEWASADYLLLLSADDFLLPGALARAVALMDAHPEVGFTFGSCIELGPDATLADVPALPADDGWTVMTGPEFIRLSGAHCLVPSPTAVVRTSLQKKIGGYRPELPHAGDMEMWFRFAAHGGVGRLHARQAVYRRHHQNMSNAFLNLLPDLNQRRAVIEHFIVDQGHRFPNAPDLRRFLERSLAEDALEYARRAFVRDNVPACEECVAFALDLDPEARRTPTWARLARTRRISPKVWTALRSVRDRVRRVTDSLRAASPRPVQW